MSPSVRIKRGKALLAKGELSGGALFLGRGSVKLLKGVGFNYDFADNHGGPIDLHSREPAIIQSGDLLVTSGLDGIFPEGLKVAIVNSIAPLQEGAFSYDLTARPAAENIMEVRSVLVLPPHGGEELKMPSVVEKVAGL